MNFTSSLPHKCECVIKEGDRVGWCPKHRMYKTRHWVKLCQTNPNYRKAWDEGRGPGQGLPKRAAIILGRSKTPDGPGTQLRKMLGCSAKRWPHYRHMNALGLLCEHHINELAHSLTCMGYIRNEVLAARMVRTAIKRAKSPQQQGV